MARIPTRRILRFYEKKWVVEVVGIVPLLITGAISAYKDISSSTNKWIGIALAISFVWLLIAQVFKVLQAQSEDKDRKQSYDHDGLRAMLYVLHSTLVERCGSRDEDKKNGKIRVTIHAVVKHDDPNRDPEELEQLVDYVGGSGGSAGRRFSIRSGIIGKVVRDKKPFASRRELGNYQDFVDEMVAKWSYTEYDAKRLNGTRQAWMAVPIKGNDASVIAVLYIDSTDPKLFTKPIKDMILHTCIGITAYISERY